MSLWPAISTKIRIGSKRQPLPRCVGRHAPDSPRGRRLVVPKIEGVSRLWRQNFSSPGAGFELEVALDNAIIDLLNARGGEAIELRNFASEIRDRNIGRKIYLRGVIELSNVCRGNCICCPMRRDNTIKIRVRRLGSEDIVLAVRDVWNAGLRGVLLQSGEDPQIIAPLIDALSEIRRDSDLRQVRIIANLGDLRFEQYAELALHGVSGYILNFEEANVAKHERLRPHSTFKERTRHMGIIAQAELELGTGFMIGGVPDQTDRDIARNIRFIQESSARTMVSVICFTPGEGMPLASIEAGDFEKTLNAIALLRIFFPDARIPAPSNSNSPKIVNLEGGGKSGLSLAVEAGANEITINYTPNWVGAYYSIFDIAHKRPKISWTEVVRVDDETKIPFDIKVVT